MTRSYIKPSRLMPPGEYEFKVTRVRLRAGTILIEARSIKKRQRRSRGPTPTGRKGAGS